MAKKTVHIDFTITKGKGGVNTAIQACRQVLNNARRKSGDIVEEVAQHIADQARFNFSIAQYDGYNDVRVLFEKGNMASYVPYHGSPDSFEGQYALTSEGKATRNPNNMAQRKVIFEGHALYFIEFGTGVHYNSGGSDHPWLHSYGSMYRAFKRISAIGEYGQGKGKHDAWVYYGDAGTNGSVFNSDPTKVLTHGNPPNRCIFNAVQSVKGQLPMIFATAKYGVYY